VGNFKTGTTKHGTFKEIIADWKMLLKILKPVAVHI